MAQIYITGLLGGSSAIGKTEAAIGMVGNFGHIMEISGSLLRVGSGTESQSWIYDYEFYAFSGHLGALYDWPTGILHINLSHVADFANKTVFNFNFATGITFNDSPGLPVSYGRLN